MNLWTKYKVYVHIRMKYTYLWFLASLCDASNSVARSSHFIFHSATTLSNVFSFFSATATWELTRSNSTWNIGRWWLFVMKYQIILYSTVAGHSTVWKLASVVSGIKSKNIAKTISISEKRIPIKRYDIQHCFDTRLHCLILLARNVKAKSCINQIFQKASI